MYQRKPFVAIWSTLTVRRTSKNCRCQALWSLAASSAKKRHKPLTKIKSCSILQRTRSDSIWPNNSVWTIFWKRTVICCPQHENTRESRAFMSTESQIQKWNQLLNSWSRCGDPLTGWFNPAPCCSYTQTLKPWSVLIWQPQTNNYRTGMCSLISTRVISCSVSLWTSGT